MAFRHQTLTMLGAAAALFATSLAASAQSRSYDLSVAPGYDRPDEEVVIIERELVQPFNSSPVTYDDDYDAPINEFAGQRTKTSRGIIGDVLHGAKESIFGQ